MIKQKKTTNEQQKPKKEIESNSMCNGKRKEIFSHALPEHFE